MRHIRVRVKECNCTGEEGLFIDGMKNASSYPSATHDGYGIAHDLLDHQNGINTIGTIVDEIEAMGGLWFVRGDVGVVRRNDQFGDQCPTEILTRDFASLFELYHDDNVPICSNVRSRTNACEEIDWAIEEIASNAMKYMNYRERNENFNESFQIFKSTWRDRMRIGYRKAKKRFRNDGHLAFDTFAAIEDTVDGTLKYHNLYEGQEFRLSYGNGKADFEEVDPYWMENSGIY